MTQVVVAFVMSKVYSNCGVSTVNKYYLSNISYRINICIVSIISDHIVL